MSDLDRQLEQAYGQQKDRLKKLDESVNELRGVSAQGERAGGFVLKLGLTLAAVVVLLLSAVLLADSSSRPWFFALAFCLVCGGAWSFYRRNSG